MRLTTLSVTAVVLGFHALAGPDMTFGPGIISPAARQEISQVEARIDQIEAEALAQLNRRSGDWSRNLELLGKLLLFDKALSVNGNEACAFCHMPETGFTGPVSSLNATTVSYPGSVRTRFSGRKPQSHTYATFAPVLHYNESQGDFVGGNFWDMRATGIRLNNPVPEQAQGPPLDPVEMGFSDSACLVYRMSQRPLPAACRGIVGSGGVRDSMASGCGAGMRKAGSCSCLRPVPGSSQSAGSRRG